jgi:hypothetical protein
MVNHQELLLLSGSSASECPLTGLLAHKKESYPPPTSTISIFRDKRYDKQSAVPYLLEHGPEVQEKRESRQRGERQLGAEAIVASAIRPHCSVSKCRKGGKGKGANGPSINQSISENST